MSQPPQPSRGDNPQTFSHFRRSQDITPKKSFDVSRPPKEIQETQEERREKILRATDSRISHSNRSNVKASPLDVSRQSLKEIQEKRGEKSLNAIGSQMDHSNQADVNITKNDVSSTPDIVKQLSKRNEMRDKIAEAAEKRRDNESKDEATRQVILQQSLNNRLEAKKKTEQDVPPQANRIGNIEHAKEAQQSLSDDSNIKRIDIEDGLNKVERFDLGYKVDIALERIDQTRNPQIDEARPVQAQNDTRPTQVPNDIRSASNDTHSTQASNDVHLFPVPNDPPPSYDQIYEAHPVQAPNDTRPTQVPNDIHSIQASNDTHSTQAPNDVHLFPVPNDPPPSYDQIYEAHPVPVPEDELPSYEQAIKDAPPSYYQVYQEARHQEFIDSLVALRVALQEYQTWTIEQRRREINTVSDRQNTAAVDIPKPKTEINANPNRHNPATVEISRYDTKTNAGSDSQRASTVDIPKPSQETQDSSSEAHSETNPVHSEHSHMPDIDDGSATSYEEDSIFPEIKKKKKKELSFFSEKSKEALFDASIITGENKKGQPTQETKRVKQEQAYEAQEKYFQDKKIQEYNALCEMQAKADLQATLAKFYEQCAREMHEQLARKMRELDVQNRQMHSDTRPEILGY